MSAIGHLLVNLCGSEPLSSFQHATIGTLPCFHRCPLHFAFADAPILLRPSPIDLGRGWKERRPVKQGLSTLAVHLVTCFCLLVKHHNGLGMNEGVRLISKLIVIISSV